VRARVMVVVIVVMKEQVDRLVPSAGGRAGGASLLVTIKGANFGTDKEEVDWVEGQRRG
jgi:hypothetical protein